MEARSTDAPGAKLSAPVNAALFGACVGLAHALIRGTPWASWEDFGDGVLKVSLTAALCFVGAWLFHRWLSSRRPSP